MNTRHDTSNIGRGNHASNSLDGVVETRLRPRPEPPAAGHGSTKTAPLPGAVLLALGVGAALSAPTALAELDAVFANIGQPNRVCPTDGSGGFAACSNVSSDTNFSIGAALGHIDGDSHLDAVFANYIQPNRVCLGDGSGGFNACSDVSSDTNYSSGVALGHIDGDSHLDAVFANGGISGQINRVCLGDGSGGFSACSDVSSDTNYSFGVALGHIDGDSHLDAVFANYDQPNRVCAGNGSGGFAACSDVSSDSNDSVGVALGLVDGDSHMDAVFANFDQPNRVCTGDGSGGFNACSDVSSDSNFSYGVALGQIDGDSQLDAVFANSNQPNRICTGDGSGGFTTCSDVSSDTNASFAVALGQVDGDSHLDVVFANYNHRNRVCTGDGSGGFTACSDVSTDANDSFGVALGSPTPPPATCTPRTDYGPGFCGGNTFIAESLADLADYVAGNFGQNGGNRFQHLRITADLDAAGADLLIQSPCRININRGVHLTGNVVNIDGLQRVTARSKTIIDSDIACLSADCQIDVGRDVQSTSNQQVSVDGLQRITVIDADTACLLSPQGNATLGADAKIIATNATIEGGKTVLIDTNAILNISGTLVVNSTANDTVSAVIVGRGAQLNVGGDMELTAERRARISANAVVDVGGNLNMDTSLGINCTVDASAIITFNSKSGSCAPELP